MSDIEFLSRKLVEHLHHKQIERFGGAHGLRDEGLLESALARPLNRASFTDASLHELAACYLFGLIRNHAFIDGNKRIAITAAGVFLMMNGQELVVDNGTLYSFVIKMAEGSIDEEGATRFLADHCVPLEA
jgi:death-on-curing protein